MLSLPVSVFEKDCADGNQVLLKIDESESFSNNQHESEKSDQWGHGDASPRPNSLKRKSPPQSRQPTSKKQKLATQNRKREPFINKIARLIKENKGIFFATLNANKEQVIVVENEALFVSSYNNAGQYSNTFNDIQGQFKRWNFKRVKCVKATEICETSNQAEHELTCWYYEPNPQTWKKEIDEENFKYFELRPVPLAELKKQLKLKSEASWSNIKMLLKPYVEDGEDSVSMVDLYYALLSRFGPSCDLEKNVSGLG